MGAVILLTGILFFINIGGAKVSSVPGGGGDVGGGADGGGLMLSCCGSELCHVRYLNIFRPKNRKIYCH